MFLHEGRGQGKHALRITLTDTASGNEGGKGGRPTGVPKNA